MTTARRLRLGLLAGCLLALVSCASAPPLPHEDSEASFDTVEAEQTLLAGYRAIVERALDPVSASAVALAALRGLATLDSAVTVSRLEGRVVLAAGDSTAADLAAPADDDVAAWAHLSLSLAVAARSVSPAIKAASGERVLAALFEATLAKLDPFSHYADPAEARDRRANRNGFGGVGLRFEQVSDGALVVEVMDDTPASRSGLEPGDIITRIGADPASDFDAVGVALRLRGPIDSEVAITLRKKDGQQRSATLRRALIVPNTVTTRVKDGIAEFRITGFNQHTAQALTDQLAAARRQLGPSLTGAVLDLRGNPGGLLDQAVRMADLFIADGIIVTTRGRHPQASQSFEAEAGDEGEDLRLVVLVDGKSASAAEILAGALQDHGRAVVIGTNSYGKGTVQTVLHLPNDAEMTLTWSRFYTPSGYALHGLGVLPTICTADERANPDSLIAAATGTPSQVRLNLAQWRGVELDDTERRRQLRATCPSARQADSALGVELAEKLLAESAAYRRALAASVPAAR